MLFIYTSASVLSGKLKKIFSAKRSRNGNTRFSCFLFNVEQKINQYVSLQYFHKRSTYCICIKTIDGMAGKNNSETQTKIKRRYVQNGHKTGVLNYSL